MSDMNNYVVLKHSLLKCNQSPVLMLCLIETEGSRPCALSLVLIYSSGSFISSQ